MHTGTVMGGGVTRVGSDGFYMVAAHVAHDCQLGDKVIMVNGSRHRRPCDRRGFGDHRRPRGRAPACADRPPRHRRGGRLVVKDVIPFGSVWGNHAHLEGLNLVGLKRRGFSREVINDLRSAYRLLFADEGTLQERLADVSRVFSGSPEVGEIVEFIRADANRPLCLPTP